MATPLAQLLDQLRTDADIQARFRTAPEAYLRDHGWGELDGADVQEAMYLLADAAPPTDAARWVAGGDAIDPDLEAAGDALATALDRVGADAPVDVDESDRWTDDPGDTLDDADAAGDADASDDPDAVDDPDEPGETRDDPDADHGRDDASEPSLDDAIVDGDPEHDLHDFTDAAGVPADVDATTTADAPTDVADAIDLDDATDLHDLTDPAHFDEPLDATVDGGTTLDGPFSGDVELPGELEPLDEPTDDGLDDVI